MTKTSFALFDTVIGACAIAWNTTGIVGLNLPGPSDAATREATRRRFGSADEQSPPPGVARVVDEVQRLLRGEPRDLSTVVLDMTAVPDFDRRVYEAARAIAHGQTVTYGEVAARLGDPGLARAVGQALGRNPFVVLVPCHRVLAAGGRPGGFSAPGGVTTKERLLEIECARGLQSTLPWGQ
jgi:methylated-DNA-[protein]-cysteine S-methyltransferase